MRRSADQMKRRIRHFPPHQRQDLFDELAGSLHIRGVPQMAVKDHGAVLLHWHRMKIVRVRAVADHCHATVRHRFSHRLLIAFRHHHNSLKPRVDEPFITGLMPAHHPIIEGLFEALAALQHLLTFQRPRVVHREDLRKGQWRKQPADIFTFHVHYVPIVGVGLQHVRHLGALPERLPPEMRRQQARSSRPSPQCFDRNDPHRGAICARPVEMALIAVPDERDQIHTMSPGQAADQVRAVQPEAAGRRQIRQLFRHHADIHEFSIITKFIAPLSIRIQVQTATSCPALHLLSPRQK